MTAVASPITTRAEFLIELSGLVEAVFKMNLEGITHADSLIQPKAGNCINWNVGHLVNVHNSACLLVGQQPVIDPTRLKRYERGSAPLTDPAEALPLGELIELWNKAVARVNEGLKTITPERLASLAPESPRNNPDETVGSLLTVLFFHQSYHLGSIGALRRLAGKPGAIQ